MLLTNVLRGCGESHIYQCSLRVCRKAESPSISSKMPTVRQAQGMNTRKITTQPAKPSIVVPMENTMVHSTSDSSVTGKE